MDSIHTKYPHQKVAMITKVKCTPEKKFYSTDMETDNKMLKDLSGSAYKVWRYFSHLKDTNGKYEWFFSPADVQEKTNLSISSIKRAVNELKELNILVYYKTNNLIEFYENV